MRKHVLNKTVKNILIPYETIACDKMSILDKYKCQIANPR